MEDRRFPRASTTRNTRKRTNERTNVNTRFVVISSFRLARICLVSDKRPSFVKESDHKLTQSNGVDHSLLHRQVRKFFDEEIHTLRLKSSEETAVARHICCYHHCFTKLLLIMMFQSRSDRNNSKRRIRVLLS